MTKKKTTYREANQAMQGSPLRWIRIHRGAPLSLIPKPGSRLETELYKDMTPTDKRAGRRPVIHFGFNFGKVLQIIGVLKEEVPEDFDQ